jgi:hypothetical protein
MSYFCLFLWPAWLRIISDKFMSPEKQQVAIAEFCGWVRKYSKYAGGPFVSDGTQLHWCPPPSGSISYAAWIILCPPDYLANLNAMHEAKKLLTPSQRRAYVREAGAFCKVPFDAYNLTAAQEAEIFLRAIGKWESEK